MRQSPFILTGLTLVCAACSGSTFSDTGDASAGGSSAGGMRATGGSLLIAGGISSGGAPTAGGKSGTGAVVESGGSKTVGGNVSTGGAAASGGAVSTGGTWASGGAIATGGTTPRGGSAATGGAMTTGGDRNTGGTIATGGATPIGGSSATGGTNSGVLCGSSVCAAGQHCCDAGCGICSLNNICPAIACAVGGSSSTGGAAPTGGKPATGGASGPDSTGGMKATGGASSVSQGGNSGVTCGGKICTSAEYCCGPSECGVCANLLSGPACPIACPASNCGPLGQPCQTGEICLEITVTAGPTQTTSSSCVTNPCGAPTLDCSCAGNICQNTRSITTCSQAIPSQGSLVCMGGGVCAAPDTPIATPEGNVPIADLRPGDMVYSSDNGAIVAVPLLRVTQRPVKNHVVVQLRTKQGHLLNISAPHPTADGRLFADLKVGDSLDGEAIVSRELVAYQFAYTYDILPASSTGTYVANGLLIGSTLK